MAALTQAQVRNLVLDALHEIADFREGPEVDGFPLEHLHEFQEKVLLYSIKHRINRLPYYYTDGRESWDLYYDINLSHSLLNTLSTVGDLINYIYRKQGVGKRPNRLSI